MVIKMEMVTKDNNVRNNCRFKSNGIHTGHDDRNNNNTKLPDATITITTINRVHTDSSNDMDNLKNHDSVDGTGHVVFSCH